MVAKVSSTEDIETLKAKIKDLEVKLADSQRDNEDAKLRAQFIGQDADATPTGREVEVPKCVGYETVSYHDDGRPILKAKWKPEKVPTFLYKIDMPPVGGMDIKINGNSLQHGTIVELNLHELRMVKEIVFRLREHEANIHGSNENAYRRPTQAHFSGKSGGRVH